jgi:hypothetical protein
MMTTFFYAKDHPEARGRTPQAGEHAYELIFPPDDGNSVAIKCGEETLTKFREFLGSMALDDDSGRSVTL